jgi:methionine-rich copper-binding protein CopC
VKKTISTLAFCLLLIGAGIQQAQAATVYANSSTGNDTTGDGTSGTPYKTFHKAYTIASATDTLDLTGTFTWTDADETGDASTSGYTLAKNLTITGQGADQTIIQASTTDNTADRRVFSITTTATISISDITIRYGKSGASGGGIHVDNDTTLTLNNAEIYNCRTTGNGGGALFNEGATTITNSAIYNNVDDWAGGGIASNYSGSSIVITNSTIYGNTNTGGWNGGGGIWIGDSTATVTNATIYNNTAVSSGDGIWVYHTSAVLNLKNSIVIGNDTSDISKLSGTITNNGYNIVQTGLTATTGDWTDTNRDGTYDLFGGGTGTLSLETTAGINDNPKATGTFAITASGSIAVDNGNGTANNGVTIPATDQRGATRSNTDIGAFEFDGTGLTILAPTTQATNISVSLTEYNRLTFSWTNGNGSRRVVFAKAASSGNPVPVDTTSYAANAAFGSGNQIGSTGWYSIYDGLSNSVTVTALTAATSYIFQVMEYNGIGTGQATYFTNTAASNPLTQATYTPVTLYCNYTSGNDTTGDGSSPTPYKSFTKCYTTSNPGDTINLTGTFDWTNADETGDAITTGYTIDQDITITGQNADQTFIQAESSYSSADRRVFNITANNVTFNNIAIRFGNVGANGGCILGSTTSTITLNYVELYSCRTSNGNGGGFYNQYISTITGSTIYSNYATGSLSGGGVASYNIDGTNTLTITNSTFYDNELTNETWNAGGAIHIRTGTAIITNSTITGNTAPSNGGVYVYNVGGALPTVYLKNNIITDNNGATGNDVYKQAGTVTSGGYNIFGKLTSVTDTTGDWTDADNDDVYTLNTVGTTGSLNLAGAAAINDNPYATKTYAILTGSIAINNANDTAHQGVAIPTADQRLATRNGSTDIGAFEFDGNPADLTSPTVVAFSPTDNNTSVSTSATFIITFSEAVDVETGNITIKKTSDDSTIETIDVTSNNVTGTGTITITITPATALTGTTEYYIQIDATAFDDTSSNSYAGITDTTSWSFTTGSSGVRKKKREVSELDTLPPALTNVFPAKGAKNVALNATIQMQFSEPVLKGQGMIKIFNKNGEVHEEIMATSPQVTVTQEKNISITLRKQLQKNTGYYITTSPSAFTDKAKNKAKTITQVKEWSFTTGTEITNTIKETDPDVALSSIDQPKSITTVPEDSEEDGINTLSKKLTNLAKDVITDTADKISTTIIALLRIVPKYLHFNASLEPELEKEIEKKFDQETEAEWTEPYLIELAERGAMNQQEIKDFDPEQEATRINYLKTLMKLKNTTLIKTTEKPFKDILTKAPFANYITTAKTNGWVTGYPDGTFRPFRPINRVEALILIVRILELDANSISNTEEYKDVEKKSWYERAVYYANYYNILEGVSTALYRPDKILTQAEMSKILVNAWYHIGKDL